MKELVADPDFFTAFFYPGFYVCKILKSCILIFFKGLNQ